MTVDGSPVLGAAHADNYGLSYGHYIEITNPKNAHIEVAERLFREKAMQITDAYNNAIRKGLNPNKQEYMDELAKWCKHFMPVPVPPIPIVYDAPPIRIELTYK